MKRYTFSGTLLSLGTMVIACFAQDYAPRPNSGYQPAYGTTYQKPGARYRSARTAFRMNLSDGSDAASELPSPSDAKPAEQPDQEVIGSSKANPATSVVVSSDCANSACSSCSPYVDYGNLGSTFCSDGGSGDRFAAIGAGLHNAIHGLGCKLRNGCGFAHGLFHNHIGCGGWNDGAAFGGALGGFGAGGASCWYGGIYGLIMTREDDHGEVLSYDSANPAVSVLSSNQGTDQYFGGAEARIGRYFSNTWAIEGAYWGIYPDVQQFDVRRADLGGDLRTALGFNNLSYNSGTLIAPVSQFFGDATATSFAHRLRRSYEIHNAEINFVNAPVVSCSNFSYSFLAGARYLKYNDGFVFESDYANSVFGDDPANEVCYHVDVDNHLIGFQLGSRMNYRLFNCVSLNAGTTFGVYNNHIRQQQRIEGGNGLAYDVNTGAEYNIRSSDDDLALLGDLSVGLAYDIGCTWRLTGGYRLLAASGIANSTSQIPRDRDFYFYDNVRNIDSEDSLILHGAYFGVEHVW